MAITTQNLESIGLKLGRFGMGGRSIHQNEDFMVHDHDGFCTIQNIKSGFMRHVDTIEDVQLFMRVTIHHTISTMLEFLSED